MPHYTVVYLVVLQYIVVLHRFSDRISLLRNGPGFHSASDYFLLRCCDTQQAIKIMLMFPMWSVRSFIQDTLYDKLRNNMHSHLFFFSCILVEYLFSDYYKVVSTERFSYERIGSPHLDSGSNFPDVTTQTWGEGMLSDAAGR